MERFRVLPLRRDVPISGGAALPEANEPNLHNRISIEEMTAAEHRIAGWSALSVTTPEKPHASAELATPIEAKGQIDNNLIKDKKFILDLDRLKELRSFLVREALNLSPEDSTALKLGRLNQLEYSLDGREAAPDEWSEVECHFHSLYRLMTEPQRRRFNLGEIPSWLTSTAIWAAFMALAALICALVVQYTGSLSGFLGGFLMLDKNDPKVSTARIKVELVRSKVMSCCTERAFIPINATEPTAPNAGSQIR